MARVPADAGHSTIAVDCFSVETVGLQRLDVLFFIELGRRRAHLANCSANPTAAWVTQQARPLTSTLTGRSTPLRFLIRDRDSKFSRNFDTVLQSEGIEIIRTCARTEGERDRRTLRPHGPLECLDWPLILNRRHLERVPRVFVHHYNGHRPHRALNLTPRDPVQPLLRSVSSPRPDHVERRDRLGGLIHGLRPRSTKPDFRTPQEFPARVAA